MTFLKTMGSLGLILAVLWADAAGAVETLPDSIQAARGRLGLSYETVNLPAGEQMGMAGGYLLFDKSRWFSMGPGFYGAMSGERGGFITLGLNNEARWPLTDWLAFNVGAFIGAGGGRDGLMLTGGGLMLRGQTGFLVSAGPWGDFGAGASYVAFPYGSIHSAQPFIFYQYPFKVWLQDGWSASTLQGNETFNLPSRTHEFALVYRHYAVPAGVETDAGQPQHEAIELLGVEWLMHLNDLFFLKVETEGAAGGQSIGYMQILAGGGLRLGLTRSTSARLSAGLGPAGGGGVDMGGGVMLDADLSLQQYITDHFYAEAGAGYVTAVDGNFKAASLAAKIGYRFGLPFTTQTSLPLDALGEYERLPLRWRIAHQTYFKADDRWRSRNTETDIDLLGFQGDCFVSKYFYLTGQAFAAYHGEAGAYMAGLVGAGTHLPLGKTPLFADIEGLLGAAGGGGVDVGGGSVWQANGGLGYQLSRSYSLMASYGRLGSFNGHVQANVLTLALAHELTLFAR
ncbi:MAG: hypothetical protein M0036_21155 [Desulfobacteraceae bacterium]|nr:hypothetical protein [Desulfobacteraceae bacterium]